MKICLRIFLLACLLAVSFLSVSCQQYSSEPYDEWEAKLRNEKSPKRTKKMLIKENWQKYDSLSYLRFSELEEILFETDSIPPWIVQFKKVRAIISYNAGIRHIPIELSKLEQLEYIEIVDSQIDTIPYFIKDFKRLRMLVLDGNKIAHIPIALTELDSLSFLSLGENNISEVPEYICQIKGLKNLSLCKTKIKEIPDCIGSMSQLETLFFLNNQITELPESIANLPLLEDLGITDNPITKLPEGLFSKPNKITNLYVYRTPLAEDKVVKEKIEGLVKKNRLIEKEEYLKRREMEEKSKQKKNL